MAKNQENIIKKEILLLLLSFGVIFFVEAPLIAEISTAVPKLCWLQGAVLKPPKFLLNLIENNLEKF